MGEGVTGHFPLEWVAPHSVGARERLFPPMAYENLQFTQKYGNMKFNAYLVGFTNDDSHPGHTPADRISA
ncbi:hypothetical protein GCM10023213_07250 [Prosthecobacter algae]|uniref:Uncharacterized protein n=1 Tax=Prosthecobacter algae TaxID=1144682 RepID=A0ABP9NV10_9BACT